MFSFVHKVTAALRGIRYAWNERHFRIHVGAACLAGVLGVFFHISFLEWAILFLLIGFVLALEMVNTIIEHIIDIFKPEFHEYAKILKDVASGAVLIAAMVASASGAALFFPRIIHWYLER